MYIDERQEIFVFFLFFVLSAWFYYNFFSFSKKNINFNEENYKYITKNKSPGNDKFGNKDEEKEIYI